MIEFVDRIKDFFSTSSDSEYAKEKKLAADKDPAVRRQLAERVDVQPEILYFLAKDPEPLVRLEIAKNNLTPRQADALLAQDDNVEVRECLAEKIARLTPELSDDERDDIRQQTITILERQAQDQIPRVRQIIAETLKDVANAPHSVIKRLALDAELMVAAPVLEFSPVLTDQDLLDIIAGSPANGALESISRRRWVGKEVADAVVHSDDREAVTELLANPSAQIREETLNMLVERSGVVRVWQRPLVERPTLPPAAAARLTEIVADHLLKVLEERQDLDEQTISLVKAEVQRRIDEGENAAQDEAEGWQITTDDLSVSMSTARRLMKSGKLEARDIQEALKIGDRMFVISALAVLADLPSSVVDHVVESKNAEKLVALTWKAGLQMPMAIELQSKLAGLAANAVIREFEAGGFPMSEIDMALQLENIP